MFKKIVITPLLMIVMYLSAFSFAYADIAGSWKGELAIGGTTKLPLIMHFTIENDKITATMDSPAQGAADIPVDDVVVSDNISFSVNAIGMSFVGKLTQPDTITGTFSQGSAKLPLVLIRSHDARQALNRPQTPVAPFDYVSEEVTFDNTSANITLAGTLTKPQGNEQFAAVILISGSGPQDRDETLFGHKPFAVIADYLTKSGLAVLRFDDRGTAQSQGDFANATSEDFASDVQAAFDFLTTRADIDPRNIGLIGHSEGGMIAPMVASQNKQIAFVVMMAGLGVDGVTLLTQQSFDIQKRMGVDEGALIKERQQDTQLFKQIAQGMSTDDIRQFLINQQGLNEADATSKAQQMSSAWMRFFLSYQPKQYLAQVKCPLLAINGSKDLQVAASENLAAIEQILTQSNHPDFVVHSLPGLNHLFQQAETGLPNEYATIENTMDIAVLKLMAEWINART
ncbi:alpha/beta fold hydrolase [Aliiglaciecola sp. LCG003]|uniref:alpha/beta hydrolase family protein n=1 Tax=Aliiglaciecola sp. LCG003 TaxID=3053655 RepID=UPI0025738F87|nr:alpha/beta fold hydrolase [Aliiglaciecola sp. LCG003]WJG08694.1 alpha/beta fold hydrolase [Aliiglaciecola sp. LCG003]